MAICAFGNTRIDPPLCLTVLRLLFPYPRLDAADDNRGWLKWDNAPLTNFLSLTNRWTELKIDLKLPPVLRLVTLGLPTRLRLPYHNAELAVLMAPAYGTPTFESAPETVEMILLDLSQSLAFEMALPIFWKKPLPRLRVVRFLNVYFLLTGMYNIIVL